MSVDRRAAFRHTLAIRNDLEAGGLELSTINSPALAQRLERLGFSNTSPTIEVSPAHEEDSFAVWLLWNDTQGVRQMAVAVTNYWHQPPFAHVIDQLHGGKVMTEDPRQVIPIMRLAAQAVHGKIGQPA